MPSIDFPSSPSLNQTYTFEGRTWKWNGVGWQIFNSSLSPEVGTNSVSQTVSLNPQATSVVNFTLHPMVQIYSITSTVSAWVRVYHSSAASSADASRAVTVDPSAGAGVIVEVLTTAPNQTVTLNPVASGVNAESPRTSVYPVRITNNDASATSLTVTLNYVYLEI